MRVGRIKLKPNYMRTHFVSKQSGAQRPHFGGCMKAYRLIAGVAPIVAFMAFGFITILVDRGYIGDVVWYLWAWFTICLCIQSILVLGLFSKKGEF